MERKIKPLNKMSKKELLDELDMINYHIDNFSYGRFELSYRQEIFNELIKREK